MRLHRALLIPALFVTTVVFSATEAAAQKAGDLKFEPYVFEASNKQRVDAEFGRLLVPENRRNPKSRLIELAFVRFKSTAERPGPPVVYLAGGPGGSGIAAARGSRFPLFMAMREIGDVIALDQRGTGMSKPNLTCKEMLNVPLEKAHLREVVLEEYRKQSRSCADYWRGQGVDLAGYNTNESADDLEDLRKALGAEKISLWAISYGTHLSLATIRRHEKSIHRVILAGVEGPDHTIKLPSNIQNHLVALDRLVKADPELSKDIPDLLGLMKRVLDRYEREPVAYEVTDPTTQQKARVTVNKTVLQALTVQAFGFGDGGIPRAFYTIDKEGAAGSAQLWARAMSPRANFGSAMSAMMDCYSGMSSERKRQIEREAKTTLLGDMMDFPFPGICDAWGSPDAGAEFRSPVKSRVSVLFISGTLDVRTPPSNAEEVRKGFSNSEHLIIEGAVHSDPLFLSSPKIKEVMLEFMKGQKISTTRIALPPMKFTQVKKQDN
jgi:pimeloyl-ACP methyl ester carboxylesterase